MKKTTSALLILCLLLSCSITAVAEPVRSAVSELYSVDGTYTDDVGNHGDYSYHVPQICGETPDADEINAEIAMKYGAIVEGEFHRMKDGFSIVCMNVRWKAFWNDNQLFLLLSADAFNDLIEYDAYGYDYETGSRITNKMILEQRGISEEEYLENLREAAKSMFVKMNAGYPADKRADGDYDKLMRQTMEWQTMEQPMFIDQDGEIAVIAEICVFAGAGRYKQILWPFKNQAAAFS